jgi:hypothetical protein
MRFHLGAVLLASAISASGTGVAAASGSFRTVDNPGGGHISTGTLGQQPSLQSAAAAMLREIHAEFGARPAVDQVAQNPGEHSLALFFHVARGGQPLSGMSVVSASPGVAASGAVLYDTTARFPKTVASMLKRLGANTDPAATQSSGPVAPAEPLTQQAFSDGTGSIGIPADWTLKMGGGGSATAVGPSGEIVCYNVSLGAWDPTNRTGRNFSGRMSPQFAQNALSREMILKYDGDPERAWLTFFDQTAKRKGKEGPHFVATSVKQLGQNTDEIVGTGTTVAYIARVQVLPPDPMGQWTSAATYIVVPKKLVAQQGATAAAVLDSVRINFGVFAAQNAAIRQQFQQQFNAMIASGEAENAARQAGTDAFLANDRAAQEDMHRQAVGMENFSLDRTTLVNTETGAHGTVGNDLADALVESNSKYQRVPASRLLRGVDY